MNDLSHLFTLQKEEQLKPKVNRKKVLINIRAIISEIEVENRSVKSKPCHLKNNGQ